MLGPRLVETRSHIEHGRAIIQSAPKAVMTNFVARVRHNWPKHIPIAIKLAFVISLLITTGMTLLGSIIITNQEKLLKKQIEDHGSTISAQLADSSKELILADDKLSLSVLTQNMASNENIQGTSVFDDRGELLASSGISPIEDKANGTRIQAMLTAENQSLEWSYQHQSNSIENMVSFLQPVMFQDIRAGYVMLTVSRASLDQALADSVRAITAATLLMITLAVMISYFMSRKVSQPIHQLMDASDAISKGELTYRISERRNDEIGNLITAFNSMADGLLKKTQVENAFSRFVSTNVAKQILSDLDNVEIGGEHVKGTVLFADIVGYTDISENLQPREIANLLNEYFGYIGEACKLYKGTIDKFMGDCAMVVFGIPEQDEDHRFNSVACAVLIQRLVERLNTDRSKRGQFPVQFRLGINTGEMLAGNMGSNDRMEFTVVGDAVNLASRLCTFAAPGEIVINKDIYTHNDISKRILASEYKPIQLRSKKYPVATYRVEGLLDEFNTLIEAQVEQILANKAAA